MSLRKHIFDLFTRPYIPVGHTMCNHIFLPFRPILTFAFCDHSFSDCLHYFEGSLWFKSHWDKICHDIITGTYTCRNCCCTIFDKCLRISKPDISSMWKTCYPDQIRKFFWLCVHKHAHGKVRSKLWYPKCTKLTSIYILRLNPKRRSILEKRHNCLIIKRNFCRVYSSKILEHSYHGRIIMSEDI